MRRLPCATLEQRSSPPCWTCASSSSKRLVLRRAKFWFRCERAARRRSLAEPSAAVRVGHQSLCHCDGGLPGQAPANAVARRTGAVLCQTASHPSARSLLVAAAGTVQEMEARRHAANHGRAVERVRPRNGMMENETKKRDGKNKYFCCCPARFIRSSNSTCCCRATQLHKQPVV